MQAWNLKLKLSSKINPLVPRAQKIKIRNLALNRLLIVEIVKKMVFLDAKIVINLINELNNQLLFKNYALLFRWDSGR